MSRKLPSSAVAARYGRSDRTLDRWVELGIIPRPTYIRGYKFWDEAELDAWDKARTQEEGVRRTMFSSGARGRPRKGSFDTTPPPGNEVAPVTSAEERKAENAELYPEEARR